MQPEDAAPCRHPGAPRDDIVDRVAALIVQLGTDEAYLARLGLTAAEYQQALPAAVERFRGSRAAKNTGRRDFLVGVLQALQAAGAIEGFQKPKYGDDTVYRLSVSGLGDVAIIQKGCPDGAHSSTRWSRPDWAVEAYLWWVCSSTSSEPGEHIWKGANRLRQRFFSDAPDTIDGVVFSSEMCGTSERPCPKVSHSLDVGDRRVPAPCVFVMPERGPLGALNWTGERTLRFPAILLGAFGVEAAAAFVGHVGFQQRPGGSDVRVNLTTRFGPGRSSTFRS
jgi:hypothetical protein